MRAFYTIILLTASNVFMTLAWYGHLKFKDIKWLENKGLLFAIFISWGIAFFEYCLQVPANRLGHENHGGNFSLVQLKIIQEVITLAVFVIFSVVVFHQYEWKWNHVMAFVCLIMAVYFVFKK
jgi:hypothetical protein